MLADLGCDYAQGDYVNRLLPVAETTTWLSRQALCRGAGPEPRLETVMSPEDVQRRLSGEVGAEELLHCLAALRADPEWTVFKPFVWPPVWIWQVVYHPTGHIYAFRAEPIGVALWRFLEE
jgi:hypothetical protein